MGLALVIIHFERWDFPLQTIQLWGYPVLGNHHFVFSQNRTPFFFSWGWPKHQPLMVQPSLVRPKDEMGWLEVWTQAHWHWIILDHHFPRLQFGGKSTIFRFALISYCCAQNYPNVYPMISLNVDNFLMISHEHIVHISKNNNPKYDSVCLLVNSPILDHL